MNGRHRCDWGRRLLSQRRRQAGDTPNPNNNGDIASQRPARSATTGLQTVLGTLPPIRLRMLTNPNQDVGHSRRTHGRLYLTPRKIFQSHALSPSREDSSTSTNAAGSTVSVLEAAINSAANQRVASVLTGTATPGSTPLIDSDDATPEH